VNLIPELRAPQVLAIIAALALGLWADVNVELPGQLAIGAAIWAFLLALLAPLPASEGAFETARKREADVLFTNSPTEEARLIAEEHALDRRPVMHSEFVLVGPPEDPADVAGISDIGDAFRAIAGAGMRFVESSGGLGATRPDQAIWASIGVTPAAPWAMSGEASPADGLRLASDQRAYLLVDLASFLAVAPTVDLEIVSQGDRRLVDAHAVLLVANASNARGARAFAEWLAGPAARSVIEEFALDPFGAPVFRAGPAPVGPR